MATQEATSPRVREATMPAMPSPAVQPDTRRTGSDVRLPAAPTSAATAPMPSPASSCRQPTMNSSHDAFLCSSTSPRPFSRRLAARAFLPVPLLAVAMKADLGVPRRPSISASRLRRALAASDDGASLTPAPCPPMAAIAEKRRPLAGATGLPPPCWGAAPTPPASPRPPGRPSCSVSRASSFAARISPSRRSTQPRARRRVASRRWAVRGVGGSPALAARALALAAPVAAYWPAADASRSACVSGWDNLVTSRFGSRRRSSPAPLPRPAAAPPRMRPCAPPCRAPPARGASAARSSAPPLVSAAAPAWSGSSRPAIDTPAPASAAAAAGLSRGAAQAFPAGSAPRVGADTLRPRAPPAPPAAPSIPGMTLRLGLPARPAPEAGRPLAAVGVLSSVGAAAVLAACGSALRALVGSSASSSMAASSTALEDCRNACAHADRLRCRFGGPSRPSLPSRRPGLRGDPAGPPLAAAPDSPPGATSLSAMPPVEPRPPLPPKRRSAAAAASAFWACLPLTSAAKSNFSRPMSTMSLRIANRSRGSSGASAAKSDTPQQILQLRTVQARHTGTSAQMATATRGRQMATPHAAHSTQATVSGKATPASGSLPHISAAGGHSRAPVKPAMESRPPSGGHAYQEAAPVSALRTLTWRREADTQCTR
mmetsp:Transcript_4226/g.17862  ORF Transcript_4226/g.17862 Transcript_4226/m.17862 type:complete len:657 (-) Transcript_4226:1999-3969(-)